MREPVSASGATFIPFSPASAGALEPDPTPDPGTSGMAAGLSLMRRMFIDPIPPLVAQYQEILKEFEAEVLVVDLVNLPAHTLRDLGGPKWASIGVVPLHTMVPELPPWGSSKGPATGAVGKLWNGLQHWAADALFMSKVNDYLNVERKRFGLEPVKGERGYPKNAQSEFLHIMPTTMAFEIPRKNLGQEVAFVGPLIPLPTRTFIPPSWWEEMTKGTRKVVHVTQGTYATKADNLVKPTIRALAGKDVLLVVTTPEPETLAKEMAIHISENVKLEKFIPHQELLKYTAVMVTNGGYGGTLTALYFGVPLICAGLTEDKAGVNLRVAWAGAGIDLKSNNPTEARIGAAVEAVLNNKKYAEAAKKIQKDFRKHDGPRESCDALEALVKS